MRSIEYNVKNMMPVADEIIGSAKVHTNAASAALTASQQRTRTIITGVGIAAVLIGLGFSWLIGRSITRPLNGLARRMKRLADGDTSAKIPATRASDEIGAMARTVIVFRDNMIERDRLTADQTKSAREKEQRSEGDRERHRRVPQLDPAGARQAARHGAASSKCPRPSSTAPPTR